MTQQRKLHWIIRRRQREDPSQNWSFWYNVEDAYLLHDGNHFYLYDDTDRPPMWYEYEVHSPKDSEIQTGIIRLTLVPEIYPDPAHTLGQGYHAEVIIIFTERLVLNQYAITMFNAGDTFQLGATVFPADAMNKKVIWSSTDSSIAVVSQNGLVTAMSSGTAQIKAQTADEGFEAICLCNVRIKPKQVVSDIKHINMEIGNILPLKVSIPALGRNDYRIKWTTDNHKIVSIQTTKEGVILTARDHGNVVVNAIARADKRIATTYYVRVKEPDTPIGNVESSGIVPAITPVSSKSIKENIIITNRSFCRGIIPSVSPE